MERAGGVLYAGEKPCFDAGVLEVVRDRSGSNSSTKRVNEQ